jgi:Zn-dependent protease with chaperone function
MRKLFSVVSICLIALMVFFSNASAQQGTGTNPAKRDPAFEQQIYNRLSKIDASAVTIFKAATEALDKNNLDAAKKGFEEVLVLAPDFPDALRRLSQVYEYQDNLEMAERLARKAMTLSDTWYYKTNLATILLDKNTPASNMEAFNLSKDAVKQAPDEVLTYILLANAAQTVKDFNTLRDASKNIIRLDPNNPVGHYYSGISAAIDQNWITAENEIRLSEKLGFPHEYVQRALDAGIGFQASIQRIIRTGIYVFVIWIAVLVALLLIGSILSQMTLAALNRNHGLTSAEITSTERLMRRVYSIVIAIAGGYFYISIPILILIVITTIGLIFYGFLAFGTIPLRLALIILIIGFYTLYAIIRSLFMRRGQQDPGEELIRANGIYLWQTLETVAKQLGTRPVDRVFVTPGTEIAVYERGSWWKRLRGQGERCLVLGLGALPGMDQGQFCSIIAHEYGHFNHADTAGGDLANMVSFHIHAIASGLVALRMASWYNPVWLFINGYYRIFLRITRGASRLQEILADRYAAIKFGVQNLKTGLEHIIHQEFLFSYQLNAEATSAKQEQRELRNLYTLPPVENNTDVETAFQKAMTTRTSAYDSHPSPCDRMRFLEKAQISSSIDQHDPHPVWELLSISTNLQVEMTGLVIKNLKSMGAYWPIVSPAEESAAQLPE